MLNIEYYFDFDKLLKMLCECYSYYWIFNKMLFIRVLNLHVCDY